MRRLVAGRAARRQPALQPRSNPGSNPILIQTVSNQTRCVEYIKFYTNTGRTMSIGDAKSKVQTLTPPAGAHLFAFKGYYGPNCEAPAVMAVWGTEKCEEKKTVGGKFAPGRGARSERLRRRRRAVPRPQRVFC